MTPPITTSSTASSRTNYPGTPSANPPLKAPAQGQAGPDQYLQGRPMAPSLRDPLGHPIFGKVDPTKYDKERANKFAAQGKEFFDKKDFKKAEQAYQTAFLADPNNDETTLRLAEISFETGDAKSAYDYLSLYLERNPKDFAKRGTRIKIAQTILEDLEKKAENSSSEEIAKLEPLAVRLVSESKIDQLILLAGTSQQQLEGLPQLEKDLAPLHSKPIEEKFRVLQEFVGNLNEMSQLSQIPFADPELASLVSTEIPKVVSGTFGALANFATADEDERIRNLSPLFQSYHLLGQGKLEEALPFLEIVRSNGFKAYGQGDEALGRERFLKGLDWVKSKANEMKILRQEADALLKSGQEGEARQKIQENNGIAEEVQRRFFDGLPDGLMEAHRLLDMETKFRMRRANAAILGLWRNSIQSLRETKVEKYTSTWSVAWRSIPYGFKVLAGSDSSKFDDINAETARDLDLVDAVEQKLNRGEASSVKEALEQIQANGSDELKACAQQLKDDANPLLTGLIQYAGDSKPNESLESALLTAATTYSVFSPYHDVTSAIFAVVSMHSRNPEHKKEAKDALDPRKLPIYLRGLTQVTH